MGALEIVMLVASCSGSSVLATIAVLKTDINWMKRGHDDHETRIRKLEKEVF